MRKSRFTEAQAIGMIKEQEAGMPTAEVCRKHGLRCQRCPTVVVAAQALGGSEPEVTNAARGMNVCCRALTVKLLDSMLASAVPPPPLQKPLDNVNRCMFKPGKDDFIALIVSLTKKRFRHDFDQMRAFFYRNIEQDYGIIFEPLP